MTVGTVARLRGLVQTSCGEHNVIVMLGGGGLARWCLVFGESVLQVLCRPIILATEVKKHVQIQANHQQCYEKEDLDYVYTSNHRIAVRSLCSFGTNVQGDQIRALARSRREWIFDVVTLWRYGGEGALKFNVTMSLSFPQLVWTSSLNPLTNKPFVDGLSPLISCTVVRLSIVPLWVGWQWPSYGKR